MVTTICDLCKQEIVGEYKQVYTSHTEGISKQKEFGKVDVCMRCWEAFTNTRMIPLVEFPNTEAKDHE
jgi:hypothetical protein